ncbi:beta-galactosidase subunit beta [Trueperella pecoris]|uniref:Beta-galactosidase subunit beta n=1 Tax=Trueperella pecoris TaxID=2733571 RepID=A0A7M1QVR3_9ACTO|nr:beta-galactosidase subunit beta [Trueperella pecoris]
MFSTLEQFSSQLGTERRWLRTLEAINSPAAIKAGAAYSIGDSLTYRVTPACELVTASFVGRKRYHAVLYVIRGAVVVDVAKKTQLESNRTYSDLSDTELFDGCGHRTKLNAGSIVIIEIDEAYRVLKGDGDVVCLHVTVEGKTFHNK